MWRFLPCEEYFFVSELTASNQINEIAAQRVEEGPERRLKLRSRKTRAERMFGRKAGMGPVWELQERSRVWRLGRTESERGMGLEK